MNGTNYQPTQISLQARQDRGRFLEQGAGQWLKCHTANGKRYGIPSTSQPGRYFMVDTRSCDCPDHQYRGVECKHIAAVRRHVASVKPSRQSAAG